jgi:hypothetical protein
VKKLPVPPITASNDELVKNIEVCVKLLLDDPHNEQQLTILNSHIYKLYELSDEAISVIEKAIS